MSEAGEAEQPDEENTENPLGSLKKICCFLNFSIVTILPYLFVKRVIINSV